MAVKQYGGMPSTHFDVLGVPVHVNPTFFLAALFLGIGYSPGLLVDWVAVMFCSVLVHELGHAFAFHHYGSPAFVRLQGFGGVTYGQRLPSRSSSLVVALAGPLSALVLLGVPSVVALAAGAGAGDVVLRTTLVFVAYINVVWSLLNLFPIVPLDGGHVVEALIGSWPARVLSVLFAGAATWFFLQEAPPLALFTGYLTVRSIFQFAEPPMTFAPTAGATAAAATAGLVPNPAWRPTSRPGAKEIEAWRALENGDVAAATRSLTRAKGAASPVLIGAVNACNGLAHDAVVAYATGFLLGAKWPPVAGRVLAHYELAGPVAQLMLSSDHFRGPEKVDQLVGCLRDDGHAAAAAAALEVRARASSGHDAGPAWYRTACAWAEAGAGDRAMWALETAVRSGFKGAETIRLEPCFAPFHGHPSFDRFFTPPATA
jgi:Zn-dependent protease